MRTLLYIILSHLSHGCYSWSIFNDSASSSRRTFVHKSAISTVAALVTSACVQPTQIAVADSTQTLVDELELSKVKLEPIKQLLEENEWDKVRQILKSPPVNKLWNLGDSKNTVSQLAKETGNIELFELKDELALSLQMCDQLTYDNAFVYFQPGNGKINIKEPQILAKKAISQIDEIIAAK